MYDSSNQQNFTNSSTIYVNSGIEFPLVPANVGSNWTSSNISVEPHNNGLRTSNSTGTANQRWNIYKIDANYYIIQNSEEHNKVMSVETPVSINSDVQYVTSNTNDHAQQWLIYSGNNGAYIIKNRAMLEAGIDRVVSISGETVINATQNEYTQWTFGILGVLSSVALETQEESLWCWAATAKMFASHYTNENNINQASIVEAVKGSVVNQTATLEESKNAILACLSGTSEFDLDLAVYENVIYTENTLINLLDSGHVVYLARVFYDISLTQYGHSVLLCGYIYENGDYYFLIKDPAQDNVGEYILSYEGLLYSGNSSNTGWIWKGGISVSNTELPTGVVIETAPYYTNYT